MEQAECTDDFVVSRNPYLSVKQGIELCDKLLAIYSLDKDSTALREFNLFVESQLTGIMGALYIGSPSLYRSIRYRGGSSRNTNLKRDIESLTKYIKRMSRRCTPYGLFSSVSFIGQSASGDFNFSLSKNVRTNSRLDLGFLQHLVVKMSTHSNAASNLRYQLNDTILPLGNRLRYIQSKPAEKKTNFQVNEVEYDQYLVDLFDIMGTKRLHFTEICNQLGEIYSEYEEDRIHSYIVGLIDAGVLIGSYNLMVTGSKPLKETFIANAAIADCDGGLVKLNNFVTSIDRDRFYTTSSIEKLERLAKKALPEFGRESIIHVDSFRDNVGTMNAELIADVRNSFQEIAHLLISKKSNLSDFAFKFTNAFGDAEIPLMLAIDDDLGVGFAASQAEVTQLLSECLLSAAPKSINRKSLSSCINKSAKRVDIGSCDQIRLEDLLEVSPDNKLSLRNYSLMGSLHQEISSPDEMEKHLFELKLIDSSPQLSLLSRFGSGCEKIRDAIIDYEQAVREPYEDEIYAEVIHKPNSRVANVVRRPQYSDYEITFLGNSSVESSRIIHASDLLVSVRRGKILLRSKTLNKYVVPRFGSAHVPEFHENLKAYKLLIYLSKQDSTPLNILWGSQRDRAYLPRVTYKNILLSRAVWRISFENVSRYLEVDDILAGVSVMREEYRLPLKILLFISDNFLPINFSNPLDVSIFIGELKRHRTCELREELTGFKSPFNFGSDDPVENELVIPHVNESVMTREEYPFIYAEATASERKLPVYSAGSEWTYFKLYLGVGHANIFLRDHYGELLSLAQRHGGEEIFFIRYWDPDFHIRLRVRIPLKENRKHLVLEIMIFLGELIDNHLLKDFSLNTYLPEFERYGGVETINFIHKLFSCESETVAEIIKECFLSAGHTSLIEKSAIWLCYNLVKGFGLSEEDAERRFSKLAESLQGEFELSKGSRKEIAKTKRRFGRVLEEGIQQLPVGVVILIQSYSEKVKHILITESNSLLPEHKKEAVMDSCLHMLCNRLFTEQGRKQEMVLYGIIATSLHSLRVRQSSLDVHSLGP